jgi:hypothetical protein
MSDAPPSPLPPPPTPRDVVRMNRLAQALWALGPEFISNSRLSEYDQAARSVQHQPEHRDDKAWEDAQDLLVTDVVDMLRMLKCVAPRPTAVVLSISCPTATEQ